MSPTANSQTYHAITLDQRFDLSLLQSQCRKRYPFLLETCDQKGLVKPHAGFDIAFSFPQQTLSVNNGVLDWLNDDLSYHDSALALNKSIHKTFLATLDHWWQRHQQSVALPETIPFAGGWFVYLAYELAAEIEPVLSLPKELGDFPTAFATRCPSAIIYNHRLKQTILVAENGYDEHLALMHNDLLALEQPDVHSDNSAVAPPPEKCLIVTQQQDEVSDYIHSINIIKDYIDEGDVFQVNLSRLWSATLKNTVSPYDIYKALKKSNPSPFAGMATTAQGAIISSSPERLISAKNGLIQTRPIAGTRPRAADTEQDSALAEALMVHPKEIAEHIMLVDLERNDMGRVCIPGSIHVTDLMRRESYAKVHHIVSNIVGRIRPSISPVDILRAVFPGGTITGCPKIRCMEIIAELENTARGPYTGSMGYINYNGDMDFNILIRTFQFQADQLLLRAGAGIVHDSDPPKELDETRAKAAAMLEAIGADLV